MPPVPRKRGPWLGTDTGSSSFEPVDPISPKFVTRMHQVSLKTHRFMLQGVSSPISNAQLVLVFDDSLSGSLDRVFEYWREAAKLRHTFELLDHEQRDVVVDLMLADEVAHIGNDGLFDG